jgi:hypothetical protein
LGAVVGQEWSFDLAFSIGKWELFMDKALSTLRAIVFGLVAITTLQVWAGQDKNLEDGLVNALRLQAGSTQRMGDSGKAIQGYARAGLVGKRPNRRADYTDYYLLKKTAGFLGHDLVMIEEEYQIRYAGCCVSPGVGVSVKVNGATDNLVAFASQNRCTFTDKVNLQALLQDVDVKVQLPAARYASLSCRERDADR